jgi:hypothetical protein
MKERERDRKKGKEEGEGRKKEGRKEGRKERRKGGREGWHQKRLTWPLVQVLCAVACTEQARGRWCSFYSPYMPSGKVTKSPQ